MKENCWRRLKGRFRGMHTVDGRPPTRPSIRYIQETYGLVSGYDRLRNHGMLTMAEIDERLKVPPATVKSWNQAGFLISHPYNDKNECLFEPAGEGAPVRGKHKRPVAQITFVIRGPIL